MKHLLVSSSLLMLIAYFTCTLSAPTPSATEKQDDNIVTTLASSVKSIEITTIEPSSSSSVEKSPTRESTTTTMVNDNETLKIKLSSTTTTKMTTADEVTPPPTQSTEATSIDTLGMFLKMKFEVSDLTKNHESEATTITSHLLLSEKPITMEIEHKSINSMSTPAAIASNIVAETTQSEMEMPINADAGHNLKVIGESVRATKNSIGEAKKGKKDEKKKALKAQQSDKKQKLKQKLFADINYSAIASSTPSQQSPERSTTNIAVTSSSISTDEHHDTTTAMSTSIKTAPTTIKSTTLTMTTMTTPATTTTTTTTTDAAAQEDTTNVHNKDNVIVLNSNSSGLIVVDMLESFGKENFSSTLTTDSFEIKMDLIDDTASSSSSIKDEIFTTTIEVPLSTTAKSDVETTGKLSTTVSENDDIILINEATSSVSGSSSNAPLSTDHSTIKWREVGQTDDIKITFDNIDLPHQNVNVSIENGELIIDSIDISVLNRAEEELRKKANETKTQSSTNGNNSLEIVLVEDDISRTNAPQNDETTIDSGTLSDESSSSGTTTIHFEMPSSSFSKKKEIEMGSNGDDIKIKTTDKDSDTIFYISNTEVKVIESIPTSSPNDAADATQVRRPAIYEEDVIVDVPKERNFQAETPSVRDKYEEDIVLSPLTSDFDPKDINYIGEAFLDVEESANGAGISENHHIIPLTSDVVVQPVELKNLPNVPIIGEPPTIELGEMMFSDDYDGGSENKQQQQQQPPQHANFRMEETSGFILNNRLVKNELQADVPRDLILDTSNSTILSAVAVAPNKTHISVNTVINGTNMTTLASPLENVTTPVILDTEEMADNSDLNDIQTLLVACLATLAPLFLCVIIALAIRYCWQKYRNHDGGNDLISDKSTDPLAEKHIGGSNDEFKSTESALTLNRSNGNVQASTELLLANGNGDVAPNHNSDSNGSIIKMTMKNNHLIVETEERNDISRDTRETKMHYSPSEKDGVFIVEAARGADQNGSHKPSPLMQKPTEAPLEIPEEIKLDTLQSHFASSPEGSRQKITKPEQVEVHTPPADIKGTAVAEPIVASTPKETETVICNGTKTGLTSSDLSLTSSNSSNQNYTYGDRDSYNFEEKGYKGSSPKRIINVHCHDLKPVLENSPPIPQTTVVIESSKPIITSAIYKNDSQDECEQLRSDMQAIEENNNVNHNGVNGVKDMTGVAKVHGKMNGILPSAMKSNGLDEIIAVPDENCNETIIPPPVVLKGVVECNGDLTMDSLSYLPAPPPEETIEDGLTSLDTFPPPPPLLENETAATQS